MKTFGQKLMLQWLAVNWDFQDMVCMSYSPNQACCYKKVLHCIIGALTEGQKFSVTGDSNNALISTTLNCDGTESHLRNCMPSLPDSEAQLGCADILRSAYVVCQGTKS